MAKKMLIDATHAEETRVVVVDGTQVDEFDFETVNKRQLAGNIYLAKVTRVEPSLQAAFVDYGGNRHGFLAFAEIHPDYYQIPAEDRRALLEEERAAAAAAEAEEDARERRQAERRERSEARRAQGDSAPRSGGDAPAPRVLAESAGALDAAIASEAIPGMELVDHDDSGAEEDEDEAGRSAPLTLGADAADEDDHGDTDTDSDNDEAPETSPADRDDSIESVADEDVAEEVKAPRKPRARRYKIQEVIKVRQIMLVQVVKEERGNKGAALTTYLSLAGRYCVLMPNTARGGGISRKITNAADRKKLKDIASELEVPQGAGLIIRTAGSQRTRTEIRRDYEYLMRLWEQIRELTFRSIAPAPIYEEGDLIKRTIRDLYSKEIDEVLVEGERGFRTARDFMAMIMPDQVRAVKHYTDPMPLFSRYQAESFLGAMFNPVVQLKSGGYIVIGVTEALVAIDVNSGRATKEGSIEETAYKTNCEAAEEIARQLRLRDLAGLIVIDFIDMDERRNNANVEKRFKEALKTDRARIQVGRISGFGLMEMSRQRLRPGMLESTTQPCPHCHGTGLIRSDDSMALQILRAIEEEGTRRRSREVLVKAPVAVANFLINHKREHIAMIEQRFGMGVRIEADPSLISPDWSMEKFKTATRLVAEPVSHALSVDASLMAAIDDEAGDDPQDDREEDQADEATAADEAENGDATDTGEDGENGNRRRRRRRRRRGGAGRDEGENGSDNGGDSDAEGEADADAEAQDAPAAEPAEEAEAPRNGRRRRRRNRGEDAPATKAQSEGDVVDTGLQPVAAVEDGLPEETMALPEPQPEPEVIPPAGEDDAADRDDAPQAGNEDTAEDDEPRAETPDPAPSEAPEVDDATLAPEATPAAFVPAEPAEPAEPADVTPIRPAEPAPAEDEPTRPKRRGWWSFGA